MSNFGKTLEAFEKLDGKKAKHGKKSKPQGEHTGPTYDGWGDRTQALTKALFHRLQHQARTEPLRTLGIVFGLGALLGGSIRSTAARLALFGLATNLVREGFGDTESSGDDEAVDANTHAN